MPTSPSARSRRSTALVGVLVLALAASACGTSRAVWHAAPLPSAPVSISPSSTPSAQPSSPIPGLSPSATPTPTLSVVDACVTSTLAKMTIAQLAGQVMLVGTPVGDPSGIDSMLAKYDFGGVFLAGRGHSSAATLRSAIAALKANAPRGIGLLISLDQEGGEVQTLRGDDFPPIPTAVNQGKLSPSALSAQAISWAGRLAAIGINFDLAPVADTVPASLGTRNPPIGAFHRQYGSDPIAVAGDIAILVPAIQSTGVITTLKHFPGLGRTLANTDFSADAVDTVTTADDPYLQPFIAGIHSGTGAVMMSSATYPKLDSASIATFSRAIVTGLLRDKLGFSGLIVSDALGGAAAVSSVPLSQRAVRFIKAGGDLALTVEYSKAPAMIAGLIDAAHDSKTFTAQLTAAATAVLRLKYTAGLLSCSPTR